MFAVFNRISGEFIRSYETMKAARKAVDRLDNKYGGYVHYIKPLQ